MDGASRIYLINRKPTQTEQMNAMVAFMENNPGVAKNYLPNNQAKAKSKILWSNLADKLNACGPPIKTVDGWKNVWKDYKYNLKRKMRENQLHSSGTGGGPNKQKPISENERTIIAILDLNEAVSGNSMGKHFGGVARKQNEPQDVVCQEIDAAEILWTEEATEYETQTNHPNAENVAPPLPKRRKNTRNAMLEQHVNLQGDVIVMLNEKLTSMEETQNAILKELQKSNEWHKEANRWRRKAYELKKEKLEEVKKNNLRKNKGHLDLLSIEAKKLELEELKFNLTTPKEYVAIKIPRRESTESTESN